MGNDYQLNVIDIFQRIVTTNKNQYFLTALEIINKIIKSFLKLGKKLELLLSNIERVRDIFLDFEDEWVSKLVP